MATMPGASVTPKSGGAWYYVLNRAATEQLLAQALGQTVAFDPDGVFNNPKKSDYGAIYHADAAQYLPRTHSAQEMLDGTLDIRRIS